MKQAFIDTSGWVALFVANDENHTRAVQIFTKLKQSGSKLVTSDYVLDETVTVIRRRGSHMQSVLAGQALLNSNIVKIAYIGPDHLPSAWKLYQTYSDKRFSFTDVTSFALMHVLEIDSVFTFDKDFAQAGFLAL